ncbi:MAG: hypothetical protein R3B72_33640 [Polyangiaceae bacterium]
MRVVRDRLVRRVVPYLVPLLIAAVVGRWCTAHVIERAGDFAVPLDDAFIHFQYARRLAEGHFFSYSPGDGYSSGATSFLWPLLLAPWFWVGVKGVGIVAVCWGYGLLLHAGVALETARLADGLAGRTAGLAAGAMALVFGGFVWFAYSGMETVALAYVLARGARVASERLEGRRRLSLLDGVPSGWELVALGILAPLVRPEGLVVSGIAVLAALAERGGWRPERWARVVLPLVGPLIVPLTHLVFTGQAVSATAMVKWLATDPYSSRAQVIASTEQNARFLLTDLLPGGIYTHVFVPKDMHLALGLGVVMAPWLAFRERRLHRLLFVLVVAGATFIVASYATMLWNRVRYIWPFAPAWLVLIACAAAGIGEAAARVRPLFRMATPILAWGAVAFFAMKLDWTRADLATSARAITLQQVRLGRWAAETLPRDARIGVNDTGAIAYFSGRHTFDVVGLTTAGEARYWAAGAGSRFEHYERLPLEVLPTHFIVYRQWMALDAVLGTPLTSATVVDQAILGGQTMDAVEARWDRLHSGARPIGLPEAELIDELDVADLESEAAHGYALLDAEARFDRAAMERLGDGRFVVDGGREQRAEDRFRLAGGVAALLVVRVGGDLRLAVEVNGARVGETAPLAETITTSFGEQAVALPASDGPREVSLRATTPKRFASYHYWLLAQE